MSRSSSSAELCSGRKEAEVSRISTSCNFVRPVKAASAGERSLVGPHASRERDRRVIGASSKRVEFELWITSDLQVLKKRVNFSEGMNSVPSIF